MIVEFEAQLSPTRSCLKMDADGQAEIKFTTDATQLSKVIQALATFPKGKLINITLKPIEDISNKKVISGTKTVR